VGYREFLLPHPTAGSLERYLRAVEAGPGDVPVALGGLPVDGPGCGAEPLPPAG